MATAEELLARTATSGTEPHIVIDATREVIIPAELRNIAVQYDHNIETVTFDCPRYWDEHDLSTMKVFINYLRPDGEPGQYACKSVTVDETDTSIMHFDWVIDNHVTAINGSLSFLVCAKVTDTNGTLKNRWNSKLNKDVVILKGLNASEPIASANPDVIAAMLLRLDTTPPFRVVDLDTVEGGIAGIDFGQFNVGDVILLVSSGSATSLLGG